MRSMGHPESEQETWAGAEWSSSGDVWSSLQPPLRNGGPSKAPPASALHTPLLLLLLLSSLLCSPLLLLPCNAQQAPPLQGQGIDPWSLNLVHGPVQVFFTVELVKLYELDEQKYTFTALLNFEQSWQDPRAPEWFAIIESASYLAQVEQQRSLYNCTISVADAYNIVYPAATAPAVTLENFPHPLNSSACQSAVQTASSCTKWCSTYGQTTPDNFKCCDMVWLPDVELRNLLDESQDRVVSDVIKFWNINKTNEWGVHRSTQVLGRFTVPLQLQHYPFDSQLLNVFADANANSDLSSSRNASTFLVPFEIVPSGVFWRQNLLFEPGTNKTGEFNARGQDQLARWDIQGVTFGCADLADQQQSAGSNREGVPIAKKTQDFSINDTFAGYYGSLSSATSVNQTCAVTIKISRLSVTAVVQTVVPVAFIAALSFMAFATSPDDLDTRLGTEITLFLALTAIQFVFAAELPQASYLTAFDIFILLSYSLIVLIIFESFVVCYICTRRDHRSRLGLNSAAEFDSLPLRSQDSRSLETAAGPSGQADEETAEDGKAESAVDGGLEPERGQSTRSVRVLNRIRVGETFLARNTGQAYRLACWIDACTAVILFVAFLILSIINFTVGL